MNFFLLLNERKIINFNSIIEIIKSQVDPGWIKVKYFDGHIEAFDGDQARMIWNFAESLCMQELK